MKTGQGRMGIGWRVIGLACLVLVGLWVEGGGFRPATGEAAEKNLGNSAGETTEKSTDESAVELKVARLLLMGEAPAVLLLDPPGERFLLMYIDVFMANAIRMGMEGTPLDRPLTHDLIGIFLHRLGAKLTRITITGLKDNTYFALISMDVGGETAEFDARPSDALALAVRDRTPIYASPALLKSLEESPREEHREREDPVPPRRET